MQLIVCVFLLRWVRTINGMYTIYTCSKCRKDMILITEEVESTVRDGKYISCSHCGSKKMKEQQATDSFKQCMEHSAYKRIRGSLRQIHSE